MQLATTNTADGLAAYKFTFRCRRRLRPCGGHQAVLSPQCLRGGPHFQGSNVADRRIKPAVNWVCETWPPEGQGRRERRDTAGADVSPAKKNCKEHMHRQVRPHVALNWLINSIYTRDIS